MAELSSGLPLFQQQYGALFRKNLLLSWRNRRATFLQLFSSFFFIFLIFCIDKAIHARFDSSTVFSTVTDPKPLVAPPIPPCEDRFYIRQPCFDFVWSGNGTDRLSKIADAIRENNPGRPIPSSKVLSFKTPEEVDQWLYDHPMKCAGALHFTLKNNSVISYGIQTNSTAVGKRGHYEDPTFKFQIPLQIAAEREIARSLIGVPGFSWVVGFKEFAHPAIENFSAMATVGPTFFLAIAMFSFVLQMSSLTTEKELKLRQAMTLMGLYDSAYWTSWLTWEGILTLISSLFTVLFGMMFQFDFFLKNSFGVVFLLFFLFQCSMISFAFMLSTFINKASSSTSVGFFIFIIGFLTQLVTSSGFPYSSNYPKYYGIIWSLFPPNLLAQALQLLVAATSTSGDPGISWKNRTKCPPNQSECVLTINDIYIRLVGTFFMWFVLAIYFDNIIPNASGVRKSPFYFLNPGYWTGRGGDKVEEGGICSCTGLIPQVEHITPEDEDVLEEESVVKAQARDDQIDPVVAVSIRGLVKTYPGTTTIGCCKCKKTVLGKNALFPSSEIEIGLWVNFAKNQLFCLLGPNGAGKTTTINCLTGIHPVTGGDALIYGHSIRSSVGMANVRKIIGVCLQFDILWDLLTGQEHLHLFANIKGLPPASIRSVVDNLLNEVKLTESIKVRAGSYSGGMKRRISVAVALIGNPKLVILDEPTTGMDPITRRHVWDVIESAKEGRAIVLTTHSMEEADVLSDRIGIMAKGRLRCVGTSIRLKSKFGTGFVANVSFSGAYSSANQDAVKQLFKTHLDVSPKEDNKSFLTFVIPHDREGRLTKFFKDLQEKEKEFGISDIQLGLATLEEVFLNIARQAELETATADGSMATLTLSSGTELQIPVGARYVGIPGTESDENPRGLMVEVDWQQDDSGKLCISGSSPETPVPLSLQPAARGGVYSGSGPVNGIVLEPRQQH